MNNGSLHQEILARRLRDVATECVATVTAEVPVQLDGVNHYIDLVIEKYGRLIAAEVELEARRAPTDVCKAETIGAGLLLIATPDAPTAHACRRQLRRHPLPSAKVKVIACPLGAALEILRQTLNDVRGKVEPADANALSNNHCPDHLNKRNIT